MTAPPGRRRLLPPSSDTVTLAALGAIVLVVVGFRFYADNWLAGSDILDFFLPNYGYVGDRLRAFEVPAWNPSFSSGTPMAGDAGGGWLYLPAMLTFALLDADVAIKAMVLLQALIAGSATYALGRTLGLSPMAALLAATAYAVGPALYGATGQSTVIGQISAFVPVGLLGADRALRAHRWSARLAWSGLAAVASVQLFAAWPQGFVYGVMLTASWFGYRCLVPHDGDRTARPVRVRRTLLLGVATAALAAGLGAAAILPRLDFSAQSTIPGGDYAGVIGGDYVAAPFSRLQLLGFFLQTSVYWRIAEHSSAIILLGLLALVRAPTRYGVPFFAVWTVLFVDLAATGSVSRAVFGLLPQFERVHGHRPTATMYMVFLPLALLAGAGVQTLFADHPERAWLRKLLPLPVVLLALRAVAAAGDPVRPLQVWSAVAAAGLVLLPGSRLPAAWQRARAWLPGLAGAGLIAVILLYPTGVDVLSTVRHPAVLTDLTGLLPEALDEMRLPVDDPEASSRMGRDEPVRQLVRTVLARHDPGTAAGLLQDLRASGPPFRYATYLGTGTGATYVPSTALRLEPRVVASLAGARAARLGLESISGYNPLHLARYVEYVEAMNQARQDYHWLDLYPAALSQSQLLDMLNVRFILVPAGLPQAVPFADNARAVYRDDQVVVFENPNAFPRAWLVHDVRQDDGHGLAQLANGAIDGHTVALVDGPPPPASGPADAGQEGVVVTGTLPEAVTIQSTSVGDGLLVVSQPYAAGWNAYVDGAPVAVLPTDHALQGVPLAAGAHTVVLRYEPAALGVGLPVSGAAAVLLVGLWLWAVVDRRRRPCASDGWAGARPPRAPS